ncbi:hypothetical protein BDV11DRAFT_172470 [Aspergillus similis]
MPIKLLDNLRGPWFAPSSKPREKLSLPAHWLSVLVILYNATSNSYLTVSRDYIKMGSHFQRIDKQPGPEYMAYGTRPPNPGTPREAVHDNPKTPHATPSPTRRAKTLASGYGSLVAVA